MRFSLARPMNARQGTALSSTLLGVDRAGTPARCHETLTSMLARSLQEIRLAPVLALLVALPAHAHAVDATQLAEMSLEDLLAVEVTSVSRKAEKSSEVAAALYVVTSEDIRRSGARTIADALRMVPGVHVGQIDASQWAIGLRGFSGQLNNKLQVLIDGRSVYTPLFSGVFWDVQDTLIEDVDRIEVIRGPGGTLWG
ncbi:MAG: TonB-dependent receptor plug domain-containing protein, partial [Candidatus Binatia bacterium]